MIDMEPAPDLSDSVLDVLDSISEGDSFMETFELVLETMERLPRACAAFLYEFRSHRKGKNPWTPQE